MSITPSIGLFSGIDTGSLIDQLLAIEARPKILAQSRIAQLQRQQAAFLNVNSTLLGLSSAASAFRSNAVFSAASATSSNPDVLTATASSGATPGTYRLLVDRLVSTEQRLSRGFADRDVSGLGATEFTFEVGGGFVQPEVRLDELNGGNGIDRGRIQITDRSGATAEIDLSTAVTVRDVLVAINGAAGVDVTATATDGGFVLTDSSGATASDLVVEDLDGSTTATSLGIAGSVAGDVLTGANIRTVSETTALAVLNDGRGVRIVDGSNHLKITTADGTVLNVNLGEVTQGSEEDGDFEILQRRATTLGDVIEIINRTAAEAAGGAGVDLTASINADGTGLRLVDGTTGAGQLVVENPGSRDVAERLGIATAGDADGDLDGLRLVGGLEGVLARSINGGNGVAAGFMSAQDRDGNTAAITPADFGADFGTGTLDETIAELNQVLADKGVGLVVEYSPVGNGLRVRDTSGGGGSMGLSGTLAQSLGVVSNVAADTFDGNAQLQWVSDTMRLEDLNAGAGIGTGEFRVTGPTGAVETYEISSDLETVGDLLDYINGRPQDDLKARINATGDGIEFYDNSGSGIQGELVIEDLTGSVARNLNIRGTFEWDSAAGEVVADGSYERTLTFDETDTLDDVVNAINAADVGVSISVLDDGSPANPYRLSVTSDVAGSAGRFIFDTKGLDLGLQTLTRGEDAVVFYGAEDPADAILLTSTTDTLDGVIPGVSIDLQSTSGSLVEVTVQRDTGAIESAAERFVETFNAVISTIQELDSYDSENEVRGVLLGDSTLARVERQLYATIRGTGQNTSGSFDRLFEIGISIGDGALLEFDRDDFRAALDDDFEGVQDLLAGFEQAPTEPIELADGITTPNLETSYLRLGIAEQMKLLVDDFTNSIDGVLTRRSELLDTQIGLQESRIESFDLALERKRASLEAEFTAMERALASLQSQQAALASLG